MVFSVLIVNPCKLDAVLFFWQRGGVVASQPTLCGKVVALVRGRDQQVARVCGMLIRSASSAADHVRKHESLLE